MERNQLIGFGLIFLILLGWSYMNSPTPEEIQAAKEKERIARESSQSSDQSVTADTYDMPVVEKKVTPAELGIFAEAASGEKKTYTLENDLITLSFTNKGGKLNYAELKEHYKILSAPGDDNIEKELVKLFEDEKNKFGYQINLTDRTIYTEDLYFDGQQSGNKVTFRAGTPDGGYIEQVYELKDDSYEVDYSFNIVGLSSSLRNEDAVTLNIENYLDPIEQNRYFEKTYSAVYFKEREESPENCGCRGEDSEALNGNPVEWVSMVNQFFNTSIMATGEPFKGITTAVSAPTDDLPDLKKIDASMILPLGSGSSSGAFDMKMYVGPNEYERLVTYDVDLEEIIPFGNSIFGDINRHLIRPFFNWLSGFIGNKGIVIIVLIFIIKMAVYPLTYKMLKSQAKMGALKPQLAGLKDKYKDDAQKVQMETMKIYREYGVSPLGGCMPMIAQIPIWYALFRFFPASITFRQEPFLWAQDLSSYDVWFNLPFTIPAMGAHLSLFTVLYAISQVVYTYYNSKHMDMSANPAMKYVQYLMPLMFFAFFNSYASGLTCYMLFSNLFTISQTIITKNFVFDNDKILDKLNVQKAKPKKKGGFQEKIAKAMEKQQKLRDEQAKQKGKKK